MSPNHFTFTAAHPHARRAAESHASNVLNAGWVQAYDHEDLVQDALLGVWQQLPRYDSQRASPRTFVERVVASRVTSSVRKHRAAKRQACSLEIDLPELRNYAREIEMRVDVERILAKLRPLDRLVATMLVDQSPTEVADALNIARSTVYKAISRVRSAFGRAWDLADRSTCDGSVPK